MTLFTLLLINVAIPLLAASIGGFVGFWGARRLQDREQKERQLAAGRALLVEVHSNYKGAQSLADELYKRPPEDWFKDFTPGHYYSRNVWRDTLHLVSPLLRWSEVETLDTAYRSFDIAIEEVERLRQQMRAPPQPPSWDSYREPFQKLAGHPVAKALHGFWASVQLMAPKVLKKDEGDGLGHVLQQ